MRSRRPRNLRLTCQNGSTISIFSSEANSAYRQQHPEHYVAFNVSIETLDGRNYSYHRFTDGSERLIVKASDNADSQVSADLRAAGATLVQDNSVIAHGDDVRRGVQAPNDVTMEQMAAEISAAVASGVNPRHLKR